jgi:Family of unknown function (DUF6502)
MLPRPVKAQFAAAMRRLLRPLVRQLIAYGVSFPAFAQMVKELYVEVAETEFALPYKRQTDSRLGVVTGIPRKEIAQLRQRRRARAEMPVEVEDTIVTHVIGRWMAGPPFATPDGVARRLAYESTDPATPSFAALVRDLKADIPVRAVLDELIHIGSARMTADGRVELRHEGHIPGDDIEAKLSLLGSDPAELFTTVVHNIEHADAPWLQRKVVYDNVGAQALGGLEKESRRLGEEFIRRANALLASYDRDRQPEAPGGARSRVVIGAYYFQESAEEPAAEPDPPPVAPPGRIRRTK